jgi:hypothetical protein
MLSYAMQMMGHWWLHETAADFRCIIDVLQLNYSVKRLWQILVNALEMKTYSDTQCIRTRSSPIPT